MQGDFRPGRRLGRGLPGRHAYTIAGAGLRGHLQNHAHFIFADNLSELRSGDCFAARLTWVNLGERS